MQVLVMQRDLDDRQAEAHGSYLSTITTCTWLLKARERLQRLFSTMLWSNGVCEPAGKPTALGLI